jgi:hypothetical protein
MIFASATNGMSVIRVISACFQTAIKAIYELLICSLLPNFSSATPTDTELWALIATRIHLDDSRLYSLYLETQPRLGNDLERVSTVQIRTALNRRLGSSWEVSLGYAWTPFLYDAEYKAIFRSEHRSWQGVSFSQSWSGLDLQYRLRQEQRYIEGLGGIANRSRIQVKINIPFDHDKTIGIATFDEIMIHIGDTTGGPRAGYDRNRIFAGPFYVRGQTRYEVGYLGEHAKRFGNDERWVNALFFSILTEW